MWPSRSVTSLIARAASVSNPDARAGIHHRLESRDQSAGGMPHGDAAIIVTLMDVRLTIRDDDDLFSVEVARQCQLEPLRRPGAAFELCFPLHHDAVDQIADIAHDGLKFGTLGRFAAGEPADFVAPIAPREARDDDGDRGRRNCKKAKGESVRIAASRLRAVARR